MGESRFLRRAAGIAYVAVIMDWDSRIRKVVAEVAKKPVEAEREESLFESGLLDSFALVELVNGLEKEFGIRIPNSDLIPQRFDSISRIERYLETSPKV